MNSGCWLPAVQEATGCTSVDRNCPTKLAAVARGGVTEALAGKWDKVNGFRAGLDLIHGVLHFCLFLPGARAGSYEAAGSLLLSERYSTSDLLLPVLGGRSFLRDHR
jgi:hypothetical protein